MASVPYSVEAAGPLITSIDSIEDGSMSLRRLVDPNANAVLFELSARTPSIYTRGWLLRERLLVPRRRILPPLPTAPDVAWRTRFETRPLRTPARSAAGAIRLTPETSSRETAFPTARFSSPPAVPVTTTSPSAKIEAARVMARSCLPTSAVTLVGLKPIMLTRSVTVVPVTPWTRNRPRPSVETVRVVPATDTRAPAMGTVRSSVTVPAIVPPCWAAAGTAAASATMANQRTAVEGIADLTKERDHAPGLASPKKWDSEPKYGNGLR